MCDYLYGLEIGGAEAREESDDQTNQPEAFTHDTLIENAILLAVIVAIAFGLRVLALLLLPHLSTDIP